MTLTYLRRNETHVMITHIAFIARLRRICSGLNAVKLACRSPCSIGLLSLWDWLTASLQHGLMWMNVLSTGAV